LFPDLLPDLFSFTLRFVLFLLFVLSDIILFIEFVIELPIDSIELAKDPVMESGEGRAIFGRDGTGTYPDVKNARIPKIIKRIMANIIMAGAYILRPSCHVLNRYSAVNSFL
jgi:hypothetical protein